MVPSAVHVGYVVKTGILCLIFHCALHVSSIHIYLCLIGAIAASLNNTRKERRVLTRVCLYVCVCVCVCMCIYINILI